MSQSILQRRLVDVSERLKRIRAELAVTEEQLGFLEEEAEDVRLRALVAERTDPVLFGLSYDYVGDLSETVALIWPVDSAK